jgi:hypothetical protein
MSQDEVSLPLSCHVVISVIRRTLKEGSITWSAHIQQRMRERGFTMRDALNVLELGQVKRPPRWSSNHQNWEYAVEGTDIDGDSLTMCVAIDYEQEILTVITGF